jgi:hypothetical protein
MATRKLCAAAVLTVIFSEGASGQHLKWDENDLIRSAVSESLERLNRPACLKVFGPTAAAALMSANYRLINLGEPKLLPNGKLQVISAITMRQHRLIIINKDGPFMTPSLAVRGLKFNRGLKDLEFRALLLLHELGHLINRFDADVDDPERNRLYTDLVLKNCF